MVVGVTGGIGAGKSTVCRFFKKNGRAVFSTDRIASDLTKSDPRIRSNLSRSFGHAIYDSRGGLDKKRLASVVFSDPKKLRKLNSIVHPSVLRHLRKKIKALPTDKQNPFVVVESALIFEAGLEKAFDCVILVHAPLETRIQRVRRTSGFTRNEILRRAKTQIRPAEARRRADIAISNKGRAGKLEKAVDFVDHLLSKM